MLNSRYILTRLLSNSDPVMLTFRKVKKCNQCSEVVQNCRLNGPNRRQDTYEQELLIRSLFVDKSSLLLTTHKTVYLHPGMKV